MAVATELKYAKLDELYLDPTNPRLGRNNTGRDVAQEDVLELMRDWTLDELAESFLGSGFWTHEALIVTEEKLYGKKRLVVVEGNRRLATLKYLKQAYEKKETPPKIAQIIKSKAKPAKLFTHIPYIKIASRKDIEAFLGFRHVTGIKEWRPAEKAEYIARLIDQGMSYQDVMRKIGSKTDTVRQHYISYRLLLQIEENTDASIEKSEVRFSVMYLSLRTKGVQKFLGIDIQADPNKAKKPVPKKRLEELSNFSLWLFGNEKQPPLFSDSRQVDNFGRILESDKGIEYLKRTEKPKFAIAFRIAGGDEPEIVRHIERAADDIELALTGVHLHKKSKKIQQAVERLGAHTHQLLDIFPSIRKRLQEEDG